MMSPKTILSLVGAISLMALVGCNQRKFTPTPSPQSPRQESTTATSVGPLVRTGDVQMAFNGFRTENGQPIRGAKSQDTIKKFQQLKPDAKGEPDPLTIEDIEIQNYTASHPVLGQAALLLLATTRAELYQDTGSRTALALKSTDNKVVAIIEFSRSDASAPVNVSGPRASELPIQSVRFSGQLAEPSANNAGEGLFTLLLTLKDPNTPTTIHIEMQNLSQPVKDGKGTILEASPVPSSSN